MIFKRKIAARTETFKARWVKRTFSHYGELWRKAREDVNSPINNCWWCKRKFSEGEPIGLAAFEIGRNRTLCHDCIDAAEEKDQDSRETS